MKKEILSDPSNSSIADKPVLSAVQSVDVKPARAETPVKEVLPAALKGSSADPNAKPVMPLEKTILSTAPVQNSGNISPVDAIQKPVKVELASSSPAGKVGKPSRIN